MSLHLYNTLTRRKEAFRPLDPNNVRMYVCGPTVYDYAHIGNARPVIVFDVLYRLLRHVYGPAHVTYARNITDVDDKINARAAEEKVSIRDLTERTAAQFHADIAALGVLPPTVEPRATEHIDEMKALIERLVANGNAYVGADHVLFDVSSMADYGKLSNRSLEEMEAGARVEVAPYKKGPMDFVLWKPSKAGEPSWASPCGIAALGRPGWHIECSAMSEKHLGTVFDIHGGGIDLVFPHHENEIAQSRCAHGTPVMANVWMHNGFLQVEGEKMSKSLGNFITINELLATKKFGGRRWHGETLRLAMLMTHYRQPIDFTVARLQQAEKLLSTWYRAIGNQGKECEDQELSITPEVVRALEDDLNSHMAINLLGHLAEQGLDKPIQDRRAGDVDLAVGGRDARARLRGSARLLGLLRLTSAEWVAEQNAILEPSISTAHVDALIAARLAARRAKDFKESDRIRDELGAMGVQLKDAKDPKSGEIVTTWEIKR